MDYIQLGAKRELIKYLREKGFNDERVLDAFDKVERHLFLDSFLDKAYEDTALHILCDQTISQPSTVAFQTMLLQVKSGEKVLEIGTGSGFQAAILAAMGARVFTVERHLELYSKAKKTLNMVSDSIYNRTEKRIIDRIIQRFGDGFQGFEKYAPYDKIIVTCGAPEIPEALLRQLKPGGLMVIPVGTDSQVMKRITKIDDDNYKEEEFGNCNFVPMLEARVINKNREI
ncbi:MAG: protein-L-isoaspartate(D-aspartate) O-methyltransferase [Bacteroidales bacterium]|nr:protein-L-isoaspartate(D-aspartate) O-methyltransferase [Bacteroidales bacterium]